MKDAGTVKPQARGPGDDAAQDADGPVPVLTVAPDWERECWPCRFKVENAPMERIGANRWVCRGCGYEVGVAA